MSDPDWKSKYTTALRELENQERNARDVEQVLRRIVTRLCLAAQGQDDTLDADLMALAEATRRGADTSELEKLVAKLRDSVLAVDHKTVRMQALTTAAAAAAPSKSAPEPVATVAANDTAILATPIPRWTASCEAAVLILKQLARDDGQQGFADTMIAELKRAESDETLADVLQKVADALKQRSDAMTRERQQANTLLTDMTKRLDEVAEFLTGQNDQRELALDDADQLNNHLLQHVEHITTEVRGSSDLEKIKSIVSDRLADITTRAREFRAREEQRFLEQSDLARQMAARVAELERHTSELHRSLHQEQNRSRLDPLTGIPNRGAFDERLQEEIARFKRFRDPVTVLVWDLDRFKQINDTYGHRAGDRVLQEVAKCFASRLRTTDVLARFGGEEFVMLLVGTTSSAAAKVADSLRDAVAKLGFHFRDTPVQVTVSCGMTELRGADTAETVFDRADAALYRAKDAGRNTCIAA